MAIVEVENGRLDVTESLDTIQINRPTNEVICICMLRKQQFVFHKRAKGVIQVSTGSQVGASNKDEDVMTARIEEVHIRV